MITFPSAKINIGLNIISKRADGYHNLETVFYPIKINDALEIIESEEMLFQSSGISIPGSSQDNLCLKAYNLMRKDFDLPNITIHLLKKIPIGAGLGGGSADAAFFIKLINEKFELNLSVEKMEDYCRLLGADCAFFIQNKPVYAFDKGDVFEPLELDLSTYHLALVMPPVHVSTAEAYAGVVPNQPQKPLKDLIALPIEQWQGNINNDFEKHILQNHPQIAQVKTALLNAGALYASMSGSGAAVYGIFKAPVDLSFFTPDHLVFNGI